MDKQEKRPIWAPWRIEYIRSEKDGACFLCDRVRDPADEDNYLVVAEEEKVFVILNRFPYNPGHLMIVPYRHVPDLSDLNPEERAEIMEVTVKAQDVLTRILQPEGFNIGFNLGGAAGAGLKEHIHMHVVPRWEGDTNFMPVLGDVRVVPEALKETADLLRQAWR